MKIPVHLLTAFAIISAPLIAHATSQSTTLFAQHRKLIVTYASPPPNRAPVYGLFELAVDLSADYENPFDPRQVDLHADFTPPGGGQALRVNGFLYQPYRSELVDGKERLTPLGAPQWRIRFAANAAGAWRYRVTAVDRSGGKALPVRGFTAVSASDPGFVHRSRRDPAVWAFAGEKPYFAVGENMCWAGGRGTYDFADWLPALHAAGGNWIRIWMNNANTTLEWTPPKNSPEVRDFGFHGLGFYSLDHAWKLDRILDLAEQNSIYSMLCFGTYGEFTTGGFFGEGQWPMNPYNAANGGPCAAPAEFWTNVTARKLYQQRVRYILARYGYRTHIHSWEFWNEANPPTAWVAEMARYVKGVGEFARSHPDPFNHLLTTTYGSDSIWRIPELDFTQTHSYGTGDIPDFAPVAHSDALVSAIYAKPHIMGEFGIDWRSPDGVYDPHGLGVNLHNTLWASVMSGDAGAAMTWWWDNYIAPKHVYVPFTAVRRFVDTVDWTAGPWTQLAVDPPHSSDIEETFTDLTIPAAGGWGKSTESFVVTPRGLSAGAALPKYLYSPLKPELRTTPRFHVNYRRSGKFILRVGTVSASSEIRMVLDGKAIRTVVLNAAPPPAGSTEKPEYESTAFESNYGIYQAVFNKDYAIDVPAGDHTITLDNAGGDWAGLVSITLTGYRSSLYPNLNLFGMMHDRSAILWIQNAAHTWRNVYDGKEIQPIPPSATTIRGLPDGLYTIAWWDTNRGAISHTQSGRSAGGALLLDVPEIDTDIAVRITAQTRSMTTRGNTNSGGSVFRQD